MNSGRSKDDYILQLKQTIIFLKSEIAKYKTEVKKLQKNDYYSLSLKLDEENFQLKKQEKQLSLELLKLQKNFEKEVEALNQAIRKKDEKKAKLIHSIQSLVKEKNDLRTENIQLVKAAQQNPKTAAPSPSILANFEQLLLEFIQKTNEQFHTSYESFKKNQVASQQHIIEKIEYESNEIKELLHTLQEVGISPPSINRETLHSNPISHLDEQIAIIYRKALTFEKQLAEKMQLLGQVEQQLIEMTHDIEEK